jgi:hypothetical protein
VSILQNNTSRSLDVSNTLHPSEGITQADIGTHAVTNCAATSTSPAHDVEQNTVAAKAPTDSALIHDTLKGAAKTRSSYVDKREDTHKQGKS